VSGLCEVCGGERRGQFLLQAGVWLPGDVCFANDDVGHLVGAHVPKEFGVRHLTFSEHSVFIQ
jgi:hypothetical protein